MLASDAAERTGFAARVDQSLMHLRWSVDRAAAGAQAASARTGAGPRLRRDHAHADAAPEARRREIDQGCARMRAALDARAAGADAAVAAWKAEGNVERLEHRAGRAEDYAATALAVAWCAIEEAHAAILDAVAARADADEATRRDAAPAA